MSLLTQSIVQNHLLERLPVNEQNELLQHCEKVELTFGEELCLPDQLYQYLYFPLDGFISLVTKVAGHTPLEIGLIGNEGMLGVTLVLDIDTVPIQAVVQGNGMAWCIEAKALQQVLKNCPHLRRCLQQYLFVLLQQLALNAGCAHFHLLEQRLARWLLMSQDRAHSERLQLTQQFLAQMLGVRRSGVTVAASVMQRQQLISYTRGEIKILNRAALLTQSCECYQLSLNNYNAVLGELIPTPTEDMAPSP